MKKAIKNAMKIKISEGNTKLGTIANISLTPGKTCSAEACKTCMRNGCYAMKAYKAYPTTRAAWDNNTDTAVNDLARFESDLMLYFGSLNAPRFFPYPCGRRFCHPRICGNVGARGCL